TVHPTCIVLRVHFTPGVANVRSRETRKVIRLYEAAHSVWLLEVLRHTVAADPRREAIVMVERPILLHVDDNMLDRKTGLSRRSSRHVWRCHACKPKRT